MPLFHFKDRIFEWWLAACTCGFGGFLSIPGPSMDSPAYYELTRWFPEEGWAFFFLVTGALHLVALAINGRAWWTPFVRSLTTSMNLAVYSFFGIGFYLIDELSTAVYSYVVMIASAAAICFYRAMMDASKVWDSKMAARRRNVAK